MTKKLYRLKAEKKIAGICAGLGEYFEVDPVIVRLIFLLFIFAGGAGIIAYLVGWLIIPLNPQETV